MVHLKNLKLYSPKEQPHGSYALYFRDEEGRDFYQSQHLFSEDTVKVCYDKSGNIIQFDTDVSSLSPVDVSVLEFDKDEIPEDLFINGRWKMDTEKLVFVEKEGFTSVGFAEDKKKLLAIADEEITAINDRKDLNKEQEEDTDLLAKWKQFRITVRSCKEGDSFPDKPV